MEPVYATPPACVPLGVTDNLIGWLLLLASLCTNEALTPLLRVIEPVLTPSTWYLLPSEWATTVISNELVWLLINEGPITGEANK